MREKESRDEVNSSLSLPLPEHSNGKTLSGLASGLLFSKENQSTTQQIEYNPSRAPGSDFRP